MAFAVWAALGAAIAVIPAMTIATFASMATDVSSTPIFWTLLLLGVAGSTWYGYRMRRDGLAPEQDSGHQV